MYCNMMRHGVKCCAVKSYLKSLGPAYPLIWSGQDGATMGERSLRTHEILVEITGDILGSMRIWYLHLHLIFQHQLWYLIWYSNIFYLIPCRILIFNVGISNLHGILVGSPTYSTWQSHSIPAGRPAIPRIGRKKGKQDVREGRSNEGLSGAWCSLKACGAGCRPRAKLDCIWLSDLEIFLLPYVQCCFISSEVAEGSWCLKARLCAVPAQIWVHCRTLPCLGVMHSGYFIKLKTCTRIWNPVGKSQRASRGMMFHRWGH